MGSGWHLANQQPSFTDVTWQLSTDWAVHHHNITSVLLTSLRREAQNTCSKPAKIPVLLHCACRGLHKNIVSTTAPERAVLSVLSLGVALWTGQSGASEVAETCFFLASIWLHSERCGGIATAPPLRRSYSNRAVTSPGGAFQTDTNLANHRHRPKLLADCQWRWRWRCGLGRLRNTRSLTKTIPRDRRKLIKLMLRKWTFLPPRSHLIRQFVKQHLVTIRREQHVLAQWLRQ